MSTDADSSLTLDALRRDAEREAQDRGHGEVHPAHLAAAWLHHDPGASERLFGDATVRLVDAVLAQVPARPGRCKPTVETTELLRWADTGTDDALDRLASGLRTLLDEPPAEQTADADAPLTADDRREGLASRVPPPPGVSSEAGDPFASPGLVVEGAGDAVDGSLPPGDGPGGGPAPADPEAMVESLVPNTGIVGFDDIVGRALEVLVQRGPGTPCFVGAPGSGRTTALRALGTRLVSDDDGGELISKQIIRLRAEAIIGGGRSGALREIRSQRANAAIFGLDDLEVLLQLGSPATDLELRAVVRSMIGRSDVLSVATIDRAFQARLEQSEPELYGELDFILLPTLSDEHRRVIAERHAAQLAVHHRIKVRRATMTAALGPPHADDELAHPGLAIDRLDRACVRARLRDADVVEPSDLPAGESGPTWHAVDADVLAAKLSARIAGQDDAIETICRRLALTSARLDLRPRRPNGVFLLVGPTGVGKTAIAKALAAALFGSEDRIVRLDMSEFAEDWSLSRLFGPHPGYIGSDQPEGWFTSRVRANPVSVVLLDEIEKAHPTVWNAFLQVFDEGRLTDSQGKVGSFADTVVLMTSNLGARAFSKNPLGFGGSSGENARDASAEADVRAAIERVMPPEFLNRIDEIIVFRPLDQAVIERICEIEIDAAFDRLRDQGWELELSDAAMRFLAAEGYDPTYGARHLQRNIERHVLESLVGREPGCWRADLAASTAEGAATLTWTVLPTSGSDDTGGGGR